MSQEIVAVVIQNPQQPVKAVSVPEPQTVVAVELPSSEQIEIRAVTVPETAEVKGVAVPADQLVGFATLSEVGPQGLSGYSGYSGAGLSGFSGFSGFSGATGAGTSGYSGFSGGTGADGQSGYSGFSGIATSGYSGYSGFCGATGATGSTGTSGYSGFSGLSGYSGFCGVSGYSGFCGTGTSGFSGYSGQSGYSGYSGSGISGYSGFCGLSGYSGFSAASPGESGYSGFSGRSGYSGFCGTSGYSGFCGVSGYSGYSGISGYSGFIGTSGYSGFSGANPGASGFSGYSGFCGLSGYSGFCGTSGYSGFSGFSGSPAQQSGYSGYCGLSGYSGFCGLSGYSGFCGLSGYSGFCGLSGYSGFCGTSGYSGYSSAVAGPTGTSGFSGYSGQDGGGGGTIETTTNILQGDGAGNAEASAITQDGSATIVVDPDWQFRANLFQCGFFEFDLDWPNWDQGTLGGAVDLSFVGQNVNFTNTGNPSAFHILEFNPETLSADNPVIVSDAAVIHIDNPVVAGTNVVITRNWCIWIDSGNCRFDGGIALGVTSDPGNGNLVASGTVTAQNVDARINVVEPIPLQFAVGTVVSKAGTITGTDGVGSSLFLKRVTIPSLMNLSEIDVAMSIGFPATNQGAGTMSRSLVLYSFGNATSLASVLSVSGTSAWATGTSTAGGNTRLTQYQGGWSSPLIQPMTFASTAVSAGEYVVGQLFNFAQASSTWTLNLYGPKEASTFLASAATNLTSATLGALSSGGLLAASGLTGLTQIVTANAANTMWCMDRGSSAASSAKVSSSVWTVIQHAFVSSILTATGSIHTATGSIGAVTNVALGALNSSTLAQLTLPNFGFIGEGSTTSNFPSNFMNGIMSTGAIPTAITLTGAGVTWSGSYAHQQPWFLMAGA